MKQFDFTKEELSKLDIDVITHFVNTICRDLNDMHTELRCLSYQDGLHKNLKPETSIRLYEVTRQAQRDVKDHWIGRIELALDGLKQMAEQET